MLTQEENQAARAAAVDFTAEAVAYQALLAQHQLPLSVDLTQLTGIYRGRLFDQLLAADAGLQARYDMARTKEAKQQLRSQTVATLDLRGHELPDALAAALDELAQAWRAVPMLNEVPQLTLQQLAGTYGLDYGQLLDTKTMHWEGKEPALAYFAQLGTALTQWRTLMRALNKDTRTLASTLEQLEYYFPNQLPEQGAVAVDEQKLYLQLQYHPQLLDMLAGPPVSQAA